jgi:hypothetical protein
MLTTIQFKVFCLLGSYKGTLNGESESLEFNLKTYVKGTGLEGPD